jgi:hypothetical protein
VVVTRLVRRERIAEVWLAVALWAWLPLIAIGILAWNPAPRYTSVALLPVLLGTVAALQGLSGYLTRITGGSARALTAGVAVLGMACVLNPLALARAVNPGYDVHPDHKGAAEFMRSQHIAPEDIIVAEDVISQAYYLDRVDYWLVGSHEAERFSRLVNGRLREIYTDSGVIDTPEALRALIARPDRGTLYIIGSGENQEDGRRGMRGEGLHQLMQTADFPVVFVGRDGLTRVWRIPPGWPSPGEPQ